MRFIILTLLLSLANIGFGQEQKDMELTGSTYVGTFIKNKLIFKSHGELLFITEIAQEYEGSYSFEEDKIVILIPDYVSSKMEFKIQEDCLLNFKGNKAYCQEK